MKDLKEEILKLEALPINYIYELKNRNGKARTFLANNIDSYGVAIENINNITVNEKFVNTNLKNYEFQTNNTIVTVLYLYTSKTVELLNFLYLAESFLSVNNETRILENPIVWIDEWKDMLGDSKKKYRIYDVIGELLALKYVYSLDKDAHWQASAMGVHDIESNEKCYEVKSTISRENTIITISSAFQLTSEKDLLLIFYRLEEDKTSKYSIDYLVSEIVELGYSASELETELSRLGYSYGMKSRKKSYNILESREYVVDKENFPTITIEDINRFAPKNNIIGFKLTLDLSGIEYKKII